MDTTSEDRSFDIIVSGHICIDLIPGLGHLNQEALVRPGSLSEVGSLEVSTGGTVSNTGLALHRLGARVGLMATVGDDQIGQMIIDFLESRDPSLGTLVNRQVGVASSYSIVIAPKGCDRLFLHHPGTNATFGSENIDYRAVARAKMFHLGYPPIMPRLIAEDGRELCDIFARVKQLGVVTSMDMVVPDPNGPSGKADWGCILRRVLPFVDVFLPSIDEALFMLRRRDFDAWRGSSLERIDHQYLHDLAGELLEMGCVVAGFKLGEMGMYLRAGAAGKMARLAKLEISHRDWAESECWHPAFSVDVVGTTGAGDSAYAGVLGGMLRGLSPALCLRWGSAVGACNVEAMDATSGVRTWEQTTQRLGSGWATRELSLRGYDSQQAEVRSPSNHARFSESRALG